MQTEKQFHVAARRSATHRALTLVELLVTITIMGLVVAISIPIIKPMMASNKTKGGADVVAGFLAQARNRAVEEGRPVGVTFERILDYEFEYQDENGVTRIAYPYNGASILMRQVAEPKPLSGFVKDVRVAVDASGSISFCTWNGTDWVGDSPEFPSPERAYWMKLVNPGDQIQLDAKGPKYELSPNIFQIVMTPNLSPPVYSVNQPALFKVFRKPQPGKVAPTMTPPVALPSGVVVDLDCSGMGRRIYDQFGGAMNDNSISPVVRDEFSANGQGDNKSVTIMFSPTGEVDKIYFSEQNQGVNNNILSEIPAGPIFLNVGIWERAGFWMDDGSGDWHVSNDYLPEGGPPIIRNYHDMNNYWVTIFPRTGAVRINRVAKPIAPPNQAAVLSNVNNGSRKFAGSLHGEEVK